MKFTAKVKVIDGRVWFTAASDYENNICVEKYQDGDITNMNSSNPRSLPQHGYFYTFCKVVEDLGFLDREYLLYDYLEITTELINAYRVAYKKDATRKLLALMFLPCEEIIDPFGKKSFQLGSISFAKKDLEAFTAFFNKCRDFVCYEFKISSQELDDMIRGK